MTWRLIVLAGLVSGVLTPRAHAVDLDSDGDGLYDANEYQGDTDGDGDLDALDSDDDDDGVPTALELADPNGNHSPEDARDTDKDGTRDYRDDDDDGDGALTQCENAAGGDPKLAQNTDKSGLADYLDDDDDGDGIPTKLENPNQLAACGIDFADNTDSLDEPDYLDPDDDNDGVLTKDEELNHNQDHLDDDTDGDGTPNCRDLDDDGDSADTASEIQAAADAQEPGDTDGDHTPNYLDQDDDGDGIPSLEEDRNWIQGTPHNLWDDDSPLAGEDDDNTPGFLDEDDDNDGVLTKDELGPKGYKEPRHTSKQPGSRPDFLNPDDDGDGVSTAEERSVFADADVDEDQIVDYLDADADGSKAEPPADAQADFDQDSLVNAREDRNKNRHYDDDDTDHDGHWDYQDPDDDGDGLSTLYEIGSLDNPVDTDKDGTFDYLDEDDDGDQVPTRMEKADPNQDGNPDDAVSTAMKNPDYVSPDDDDDGIPTKDELGPGGANHPRDSDGDKIPDYLDIDDDNDGIAANGELPGDTDGDGTPNYLDADDDGDGIPTKLENELKKGDLDGDKIPNAYDSDDDGDGIPTREELGSGGAANPRDTDADGIPDVFDSDDDGDGVLTKTEQTSRDLDSDQDGTPDYLDPDDDGDGIPTAMEGNAELDSDGDGIPNRLDTDANGDGVPDATQGSGDADKDGIPDFLDKTPNGAAGPSGPANTPDASDTEDAGTDNPADSTGIMVLDRPKRDTSSGCAVAPQRSNGPVLSMFAWALGLLWLARRRARGRMLRAVLCGAVAAGSIACGNGGTKDSAGVPLGTGADDADAGSALDASRNGDAASQTIDGGLDDDGSVPAAKCQLEGEPLAIAVAEPEAPKGRAFDLIVRQNEVQLVYLKTTCAGSSAPGQKNSGIEAISGKSTGPFASPTAIANMDVCRWTRSPAIADVSGAELDVYYAANNENTLELYRKGLSPASDPERLTNDTQAGGRADIETLTTVVSYGDTPLIAYANELSDMSQLVTRRPGLSENEILPRAAGHHPVKLSLASLANAGALGWVSDADKALSISLQPLDAAGKASGDRIELSQQVGGASNIAIAAHDTSAAVVYTVAPNDYVHELRFRALDLAGKPDGPEIKLTSGNRAVQNVSIARYASGYVIAFRMTRGSGRAQAVMQLMFVDARGNVAGERYVTDASQTGGDSQIAVTNDGRFVLAWTDLVSTQTDAGSSETTPTLRVARATCD